LYYFVLMYQKLSDVVPFQKSKKKTYQQSD
jgi:hypothetical protein